MSTKKILRELLEDDIVKKLDEDENECEKAIEELFNIIQYRIPEVTNIRLKRDYDPMALTILFYIDEYHNVITYFTSDGKLIEVNINNHRKQPGNKNDIAQIKLTYILLSGELENVFRRKIPRIIELCDKFKIPVIYKL